MRVQAVVRLVVLCILLATAGAVTKLMAMNMEAARSVVWQDATMDGMIRNNMRVREALPWQEPGRDRLFLFLASLEM